MQTGTAALSNPDAQSFLSGLRAHQCSQLPHRAFGNLNHSLKETYDPPLLSQLARALPYPDEKCREYPDSQIFRNQKAKTCPERAKRVEWI
jgi:hypothetical protein